MSTQPAPRFVWWQDPHVPTLVRVFDTRPSSGEPGQVVQFGQFDTVEAARMTCMSLNGSEAEATT